MYKPNGRNDVQAPFIMAHKHVHVQGLSHLCTNTVSGCRHTVASCRHSVRTCGERTHTVSKRRHRVRPSLIVGSRE